MSRIGSTRPGKENSQPGTASGKEKGGSAGDSSSMRALLHDLPCLKVESVRGRGNSGKPGVSALDLTDSASRGDLHEVMRLLGLGVSASAVDPAGDPAICAAALGGHTQVVVALLEAGASAQQCTSFKETPLHLAARHGFQDIVQALLSGCGGGAAGMAQVRSLLGCQNYMGSTALHTAAEKGNDQVCELLASAWDEGLSQQDHSGRTPLQLAVYWGHNACVKTLLDLGADPHARGGTAGEDSAQGGRVESAVELAQHSGHTDLQLLMISHLYARQAGQIEQLKDKLAQECGLRMESERREGCLREELSQLQCDRQIFRDRLRQYETRVIELEADRRAHQGVVQDLKERAATAEEQAEGSGIIAERLKEKLEDIKKDLAASERSAEVAREAGAQLRRQLATQSEQVAELETSLAGAKEKLSHTQQGAAEARSRVRALEAESAGESDAAAQKAAELNQVLDNLEKERIRGNHLERQVEELQTKLETSLKDQGNQQERMRTLVENSARMIQDQFKLMKDAVEQNQ